jgi:hypothetical protein
LVWAGEARTMSGASSPQPPHQITRHADYPPQGVAPATPPSPDAERR